jgi:hypothetical protein
MTANGDDPEVVWPLHRHHYLTAFLDLGADIDADHHLEASDAQDITDAARTIGSIVQRATR